ncbi:guanitoxin biosynthesis L-enduracididine beta-hydroxylase GntD [Nonomuraea guangzhouensis]|uniref:Guanitoxin biosynthesis L-enduracididine beta-hydroxylase GntD n=1 Tax=Nonomuraea guangzhouensis TaxID=1291555 RepID=A0ABW4GCE2_9ACTN|nr:guanitoxin biosynthesis L-enduracididine beta-hydroxylase GntD [Nonomuraea guangzhouensis]
MSTFELRKDEATAIVELAGELARHHPGVESAEFQKVARTYADELPRRLREDLHDFRLAEPSGLLVISGLPVDDATIGATPDDWKSRPTPSPTLPLDIAFYLVMSLLGEPIGWSTQQDGRIMHDVFPMRGYEREQIGWSSTETLVWHTEDAFHPLRTDYLGLMCLRNHDKVETTYADVGSLHLDEATEALLRQPRFFILPDDSHRPENRAPDRDDDPRVIDLKRRSYRQVESALTDPKPVPVLFGAPDDPYLCVDPHYMQGIHGEDEEKALAALAATVDAAMTGVVLEPGDVCVIDNYKAVHGRKPFRPRFDGTDRWLRRLNVARDLRKSREFRLDARSRVIY